MEMRQVFSNWLQEAMAHDPRLCVLDADLANANGTLGLRKLYPDRAFDVGVAEQNMASVAAGMASYGFIPFITTFACFASRRICDQIAISCAYARQNVKIVGTDPGITAELNGGTHMAVEDLGVLRSIPGLVLFEPCDAHELLKGLPELVAHEGPVYLRLHRKALKSIHEEDAPFSLFQAELLRSGVDVTLFAMGGVMVPYALEAAGQLKAEGISAEVVNVHTLKPLDRELVAASVRRTGAAVTCENHSVIGGLHSAVCEALAHTCPAPVEAIGFQDVCGEVGQAAQLAEKHGLCPSYIVQAAKTAISKKQCAGSNMR